MKDYLIGVAIGIAALAIAYPIADIVDRRIQNARIRSSWPEETREFMRWQEMRPKLSSLYASAETVPFCREGDDMTEAIQYAVDRASERARPDVSVWDDIEHCVAPHAVRFKGGQCRISKPINLSMSSNIAIVGGTFVASEDVEPILHFRKPIGW